MWTSVSIPLGLALVVILVDVFTIGVSEWIYAHTLNGGRIHGLAKGIEDLAKSLLPQFLGITFLLVAIALFAYAFT